MTSFSQEGIEMAARTTYNFSYFCYESEVSQGSWDDTTTKWALTVAVKDVKRLGSSWVGQARCKGRTTKNKARVRVGLAVKVQRKKEERLARNSCKKSELTEPQTTTSNEED
ncbi:hypothetical protein JHK87_024590 [Glycine soja]|nr:hypothetical protein JHK87_024590 [Glycine soja]